MNGAISGTGCDVNLKFVVAFDGDKHTKEDDEDTDSQSICGPDAVDHKGASTEQYKYSENRDAKDGPSAVVIHL